MEPLKETKQKLSIDNEGNAYVRNRATRRKRPPTDNWFTKATHKIKKLRSKNAPTKQQRKTAAARARKARKESYTQIS